MPFGPSWPYDATGETADDAVILRSGLLAASRRMSEGLSSFEARKSSHLRMTSSLHIRHQRGVAAGGRGIDGHGLFGREARQIMRTAGLRTRAGQSVAAERLHADHSADHVAVDIDVADGNPVDHRLDRIVDARMNAERQPVAGTFDRL